MGSQLNFVSMLVVCCLFCPASTLQHATCCLSDGTTCTLAGSGVRGYDNDANPKKATFTELTGVAVNQYGEVIVAGNEDHSVRIIRVNRTVSMLAGGGAPMKGFRNAHSTMAMFSNPKSVAVTPHDDILVADSGNNRIRIIMRNGSVETYAGHGACPSSPEELDAANPQLAGFCAPAGVAFDPAGNLIVAGGNDNRVRLVHAGNGTVETIAGSGPIGSGWTLDSVDPLSARFHFPSGVACDHDGNIIVAEYYGNVIRRLYRGGVMRGVVTVAGQGNGAFKDSTVPMEASFFNPYGVAVDQGGNILVAGNNDNRIRILWRNGTVGTLAGYGDAGSGKGGHSNGALLSSLFNSPRGIALFRSGHVAVADTLSNQVGELCIQLAADVMPSHSTSSSWVESATVATHGSATNVVTDESTMESRSASLRISHTGQPTPTPHVHTSTPTIVMVSSSVTPTKSGSKVKRAAEDEDWDAMRLLLGEDAARAIVASRVAAAGVASVVGVSTVAAAAVRIGPIARTATCGGNQQRGPTLLQYPFSFSLCDTSDSELAQHVGGVLSTVLLFLSVFGVGWSLAQSKGPAKQCHPARALQIVRAFEALCLQYYLPSVVEGTSLVIIHSSSAAAVALCASSAACCIAVAALRCFAVLALVPQEARCECGPFCHNGASKAVWEGPLCVSHGAYFDMCRDDKKILVKSAYFVELGFSLAIACVGAWSGEGSCGTAAGVMFGLCILLAAYEMMVRPYSRLFDTTFALAFAALGTVQSLCAVCATLLVGQGRSVSLDAVGVVSIVLSCFLLLQLGATVFWRCYVSARRKAALQTELLCDNQALAMPSPTTEHAQPKDALGLPLLIV